VSALLLKKKLIEKFIEAKELAKTDPPGMVGECLRLLEEPNIDQSVRRGDLFAVIV
jgi:hypothetical protein